MTEKAKRNTPIVFISSTVEDLEPFRKRARDAALAAGFQPRMMEYFPASGNPPLEECLARVSGSRSEPPVHLLIAIVAHRYGWVPDGQEAGEHKSITWLECLEAQSNSLEVLAFLIDEKADWPEKLREGYELAEAVQQGKPVTSDFVNTVQKNVAGLKKLKAWLSDGRVRSTFTNPDDLQSKILIALQDWLKRHSEYQVDAPGDASPYLRTLREETAYINIRGLQVGSGKATRFPIEELYISLKTIAPQDPSKGNRQALSEWADRLELEKALANSRLVLIGDPGAGKTTFLRRICQLACRGILDDDKKAIRTLTFPEAPFPILIRLSELQDHRTANKGRPDAPAVAAAPEWLIHFLASQWAEDEGGLDSRFFRRKLQESPTLLVLDGLDEASSERDRASLVKWIEKVAARWENCRIVVTSRPAAYRGDSVLPGFAHASIEALGDSAIEAFLSRWCQALFPSDTPRAERHKGNLMSALRSRPEIRRMACNPVMLTALAVVHWNEKRLPEQRADLYESILTWLSRSRENRLGRTVPERCLINLQALALAMQEHKEGRQVQVSRRWAAEIIAPLWRDGSEGERIAAAQEFLDEEEQDSGIVVRRGSNLRFWHLTFQEYLAARALAGMTDQEQHQRVLKRLHASEWRQVALLLAGILYAQGVDRVDNLVSAALKSLGSRPTLPQQARCAGILGAIVRDLNSFEYQPSDSGYQDVLVAAMAVFDRESSKEIAIEVAIEAAEALGQVGDPRFEGNHAENNWAEIPAGEFWMGAQQENAAGRNFDEEVTGGEGPVHRVHLDAYRIARFPVTVTEYQRFVQAGGYEEQEYWKEGGFGEQTLPDEWESQIQHLSRPVVGVSWFEAAAFAQWACARLPTEAQWERAARGTERGKFPWGSAGPCEALLNCDFKVGHPTPVGVYPRGSTPEGIMDLAGNVFEWCQDWYGAYPDQLQRNPTGPKKGTGRVLRGGAWFLQARFCRSSYRNVLAPTDYHGGLGFRLVF